MVDHDWFSYRDNLFAMRHSTMVDFHIKILITMWCWTNVGHDYKPNGFILNPKINIINHMNNIYQRDWYYKPKGIINPRDKNYKPRIQSLSNCDAGPWLTMLHHGWFHIETILVTIQHSIMIDHGWLWFIMVYHDWYYKHNGIIINLGDKYYKSKVYKA